MLNYFFSFKGRIRRAGYWLAILIAFSIFMIFSALIAVVFRGNADVLLVLFGFVFYILIPWFMWAQGAKRCHDLGKSGWWQLIPFYVFWMLFEEGERGSNQYGENPKGLGNSKEVYGQKHQSGAAASNSSSVNQDAVKEVSQGGEDNVPDSSEKPYFISVFGNYGIENRFTQLYFGLEEETFAWVQTFKLDTTGIKLFPDTRLYAIRKEVVGGHRVISYSVYSFLEDKESESEELYIGSSILFITQIADEQIILNNLHEVHEGVLNKVKDTYKIEINKPQYFDNIRHYLKDINQLDFDKTINKPLVVYDRTTPDNLQKLLEQSLVLLNTHDVIYFTESHEIAEFVYQQGVYRVVDAEGFDAVYKKTNNQ